MPNDFSADSTCIALWNYNAGLLTHDSKNGNTLSYLNSPAESTTRMEGDKSAYFDGSTTCFFITDLGLSADFPLKSGTTNKEICGCTWARLDAAAPDGTAVIASKWDASANKRGFYVSLVPGAGPTFAHLSLGDTNGNETTSIDHGGSLSDDTFYHVTWGYRDSDKQYILYVRDSSGNVVGTDLSGTATDNIGLFDNEFLVGARGNSTFPVRIFQGYLDEMVIFNTLISADKATQIAQQIYPSAPSTTKPLFRGS